MNKMHSQLAKKDHLLSLCKDSSQELTFFDIGACEGESAIDYKSKFPKAHIHLFEPLPDNMVLIKKHIQESGFTGLYPNETCLSDKEGLAEFFVSSGSPSNSELKDYTELDYWNKSSSLLAPGSIEEHYKWLEFKKKIQVSTTTLDLYCKEKKISGIDFIHMDVQGAELMVLNGAAAHMSTIDLIWMEVSSLDIYKDQPLKKEVNDYMKRFGFFKALDIGDHVTGDELWIRKAYMKTLPQETQNVLKSEHMKSSISFRINSIISSSRKYLSKLKNRILGRSK
jgi:FkbM family methyltransferase